MRGASAGRPAQGRFGVFLAGAAAFLMTLAPMLLLAPSAQAELGAVADPAQAGGPSGFAYCVVEGAYCSFTGTRDVAYGAAGSFRDKVAVTGGVLCDNGVFGDSFVGTLKGCYTRPSQPGPPPSDPALAGYAYCATEWSRCTLPGASFDVAYGAAGAFRFQFGLTGEVDCNNGVFGDPNPGVLKACFAKPGAPPAPTPPPSPWPAEGSPTGFSFCAPEGGSCAFAGLTQDVAYGIAGRWMHLAAVSAGVACANEAFGRDPYPGYLKACYTRPAAPLPPDTAPIGNGPRAGADAGRLVVWVVPAAPGDALAPRFGCNANAVDAAIAYLESIFPGKSGAPLDIQAVCVVNDAHPWNTSVHAGSYVGPDGAINDPTDGYTDDTRVLKWRLYNWFTTNHPDWQTRNGLVFGWVGYANHNGEAMGMVNGWSAVGAETCPVKPYCAQWPEQAIFEHELGHLLGAYHYPDEAHQGIGDCGYASVMNYCSAFLGEQRFDATNHDIVWENLWDATATTHFPQRTDT